MKRLLFLLPILFVFFQSVFIQPTLASSSDEDETSSTTGLNAFAKIILNDGDTVKALINTIAPTSGFNIVGDVISIVFQEDQHNYIDMTPFVRWLEGTPFIGLTPGYMLFTKPFIPFTTPQTGSSHYGAILKISGFDILTVVSDCFTTNGNPPEQSQEIEGRKELYQYAQHLASRWSGASVVTTEDGRVKYDWPNFVVKRIRPEDCGREDPKVDRKPLTNDMTIRAVFSEGEAKSYVLETLYETIVDAVTGEVTTVLRTLGVNLSAEVTQKLKTSGNGFFALLGLGFTGDEIADAISDHTRTKKDGAFSSNVPFKNRRYPIGYAGTDNEIKLSGNYANDPKQYVSREVGANRAYTSMQKGACPMYAYQILKGKGPVKEAFKIGGEIATDCASSPSPTPKQCQEADTYDEILKKLPNAIGTVCSKYASNLSITTDQCKGMMNEIFNIEIRNDPEWSEANYRCAHRSDSTAAGPFQIIDETYHRVACDSNPKEDMQDDLNQCAEEKQLSRCITEDAAELAMRVLLHYSDCKNVGKIGTTAELYESLCNYGTGVGVPQEHLDGKTYCEWIFDVVGIPKP